MERIYEEKNSETDKKVAGQFLSLAWFLYICNMETLNIEILNPKAKRLLMDLAEMRLISISEPERNPFLETVKKIRSKKAKISLEEITKEVESVRSKRYGK
jgi:hypothetical protein